MKKTICIYLTLVLILTGCGNIKRQITGKMNTKPADQLISSNEKLDNDGNSASLQKQDESGKDPSKEPELTWLNTAEKSADNAKHFLYEYKKQIVFMSLLTIVSFFWIIYIDIWLPENYLQARAQEAQAIRQNLQQLEAQLNAQLNQLEYYKLQLNQQLHQLQLE